MKVTNSLLVRAAGAAAIAAGVVFIGVQISHPSVDVASITTTELAVRNTLKVLMAMLALAGLTGMYVSQIRRNGVLGLVGYVVLCIGYLLMMSTALISASVLPSIARTDPSYVGDVLARATGGTPQGDIGIMSAVFQVQDLGYLAGGLIFGLALFRARVLTRWAAALLAVGGIVTLALSVMPDAFYRLLAFPNGIAMSALGCSLWRRHRPSTAQTREADEARPQHAVLR